MPEKCMGCLYGERKTKESDFIPETRQKKPSRHSGIIAKIKIFENLERSRPPAGEKL